MSHISILPSIRHAVAAAVLTVGLTDAALAVDQAAASLPRVPPGTAAVAPSAARFNRVVYLAVSRIASGDAEAVPTLIRNRVPLFTLALLATVNRVEAGNAASPYRLAEVGAGYAVPLDGRLIVIDPSGPPAAAGIDLVGRQVLAANGRHLAELRLVGGNDTMQVIDVDALFHRDGRHAPLVMRHFVWVEPTSGQSFCCVWLLTALPDGSYRPTADAPRWLREGTRDDRAIHVDKAQFFLGMPTREAFALTELPPGTDLTWSTDLRQAATAARYSDATLRQLAAAVTRAVEPLRRPAR